MHCTDYLRRLSVLLVVLLSLLAPPLAAQSLLQPAAQGEADQSDVLAPLLDVLEDDAARAELIEALRNTAPEATTPEAASEEILAVQVTQTAITLVTDLVGQIGQSLRDVGRLARLPDLLTEERMAVIRAEAPALLITIVLTILVYRAVRFGSRRLVRGKGGVARSGVLTFIAQIVLRVLSVVLAVVVGFAISPLIYGGAGLAVSQSVYLSAFAALGAFTVVLSIFVSKYPEDVTFSGLPNRANAAIYKTLRFASGVLTYGLVAVVPIAQHWVNFVAARSLRTTVVLAGATLTIYAIWRISRVLKAELARQAAVSRAEAKAASLIGVMTSSERPAEDESFSGAVAQRSLSIWQRVWPFLGYLYVIVATLVALAKPNLMVEIVGRATLLTALALIAILGALRLFSLATAKTGIPLPQMVQLALPTLQKRLSTFAAPALVLAGVALLVAAVLLMLEGWQIADVQAWVMASGADLFWRIASVLLILGGLILTWVLLASWIDKRLMTEGDGPQVSARSRTLLALFRNALSIALVIFGGMTALSELGLDIAPLLAGAGVIGLAIGFGAQKLVQDIITGIFIQLENAINEGDVITVAGITGGVEKLSIRSVGIRDLTGTFHLIPFSAVDTVSNATRVFSYHVEVVGIAYDSDLDVARKALEDAFEELQQGELGNVILSPMEYHGVVGLGDSSVNLRVRIKTLPGQQWGLGRAYTALVKKHLDAAGVEIPFPHRELKLPKELLDRLAPPALSGPPESATE